MERENTSYRYLQHFIRALSHEIRTPLSVISNELYILKQQSSEAERALKQIGTIKDHFSKFEPLLFDDLEIERKSTKLLPIIKPIADEFSWKINEEFKDSNWLIHEESFKSAFKAFLRPFTPSTIRFEQDRLTISHTGRSDQQTQSLTPMIECLLLRNGVTLHSDQDGNLILEQAHA